MGFALKWSDSEKNVKAKYYFTVPNDEFWEFVVQNWNHEYRTIKTDVLQVSFFCNKKRSLKKNGVIRGKKFSWFLIINEKMQIIIKKLDVWIDELKKYQQNGVFSAESKTILFPLHPQNPEKSFKSLKCESNLTGNCWTPSSLITVVLRLSSLLSWVSYWLSSFNWRLGLSWVIGSMWTAEGLKFMDWNGLMGGESYGTEDRSLIFL